MRISLFAFSSFLVEFAHAASLVQVMDSHQVLTQQSNYEDYSDLLAFQATQTTAVGDGDLFDKAVDEKEKWLADLAVIGNSEITSTKPNPLTARALALLGEKAPTAVTAASNVAKAILLGLANNISAGISPDLELAKHFAFTDDGTTLLSLADLPAAVDPGQYKVSALINALKGIHDTTKEDVDKAEKEAAEIEAAKVSTKLTKVFEKIGSLPVFVHFKNISMNMYKLIKRPLYGDHDACFKNWEIRSPWKRDLTTDGACTDSRYELKYHFLCIDTTQCSSVTVSGKHVEMVSCGPFCATKVYCETLSTGLLADLVGLAITIGTTLSTGGFGAASPITILNFVSSIVSILEKVAHPNCPTSEKGYIRTPAIGRAPTLTAPVSVVRVPGKSDEIKTSSAVGPAPRIVSL